MVVIGERVPAGPPPGIHDPKLFVAPRHLAALFERRGIRLRFRGLRPDFGAYLGFVAGRRTEVPMVPTRSLGSLYQAIGRKAA